jgi:membrane associated rhomboid family serine protease
MFIPLRHENNEGRRWPVISLALIVINLAVFLGTHWQMDEQNSKDSDVPAHILLLAAMHPQLSMPPDVNEFVTSFQQKHPDLWKEATSETRNLADAWDARIRLIDDERALQREMDTLAEEFSKMKNDSILGQYAFVPAHPRAITYVTANFLHAGWLHLIGNMWFLWLAGAILEDTWGRLIYPVFYFAAGAAALQFHAWINPGSNVPTLGASGAVAALMGAFLMRFPTTKIEVALVLGLRSLTNLALGKGIRFKAAAYWLLPLWVLMEILSGSIFGGASGVAHWAHVGGFVFGLMAALVIRYSGVEQQASEAIDKKVSWTADPLIAQAGELMEHGKVDEAIAKLTEHLNTKPDSVDARTMLQQLYWRKGDTVSYQNEIVKLCQAHLKAQDKAAAWHDYEEFQNSGGEKLPAATWLELGRYLEEQQNFDRAVSEYEKLAAAWPAEKPSLLALISAGRLSLKNLNRPADALRFYQAASASPIPHLDWETNIQTGIKAATAATTQTPVSV